MPEYICDKEIVKNPASARLQACLRKNEMQSVSSSPSNEVEAFQKRHPSLGRGETEVILCASSTINYPGQVYCVLDDGPARKIASELGLPVIGTVGLINCLQRHSLVTAKRAEELKKRLRFSSFRIDGKLLS